MKKWGGLVEYFLVETEGTRSVEYIASGVAKKRPSDWDEIVRKNRLGERKQVGDLCKHV